MAKMERLMLPTSRKLKGKKKHKMRSMKGVKTTLPVPPRCALTDEIAHKFCELVRKGLPFDACCDYLGIVGSTFADWRKKGGIWLDGNHEPPEYELYGRFCFALRHALAAYRLEVTEQLHDRHNQYWVRCLAILSRRDRTNWAEREPAGGATEDVTPDERFR